MSSLKSRCSQTSEVVTQKKIYTFNVLSRAFRSSTLHSLFFNSPSADTQAFLPYCYTKSKYLTSPFLPFALNPDFKKESKNYSRLSSMKMPVPVLWLYFTVLWSCTGFILLYLSGRQFLPEANGSTAGTHLDLCPECKWALSVILDVKHHEHQGQKQPCCILASYLGSIIT